jgi:hypothetical protein
MNFFRSMEIDPHLQIFTTSIAVRRNLLLWVLCTSTFSRNQDPKPTSDGISHFLATLSPRFDVRFRLVSDISRRPMTPNDPGCVKTPQARNGLE